jgi:DNA-binding beta-propeller fold protein YncE
LALTLRAAPDDRLAWPGPPDRAYIEYVGSIECRQLSPAGGIFSKLVRWIGGQSKDESLTHPFDLLALDKSIFMVCQSLPGLVEVDRDQGSFKLHRAEGGSFRHPISLGDGGNGIVFVTDSEAGAVFKYHNGQVRPFITEGLTRPTGIAVLPDSQRIFIVDTGEQCLKIFDFAGNLIRSVSTTEDGLPLFNYPTFATACPDGTVLVNDGLNYEIKRFDVQGNMLNAFGQEGDGPGALSRPKGIAIDSDAHIYVVDNLFDNVQIFDPTGQVLLALGSGGVGPGEFWSPAGIDIAEDTIFIADTYNHRIQILRYLGEQP